MAGLLYFLPGEAGVVNRAKAEAAGLGYAFDSPSIITAGVQAGPAGTCGGALITADGHGVSPAIDEQQQTWQKHRTRDYWIGLDRRGVPGPEDLERREILDGHPLELADGRQWLVPVARGAAEEDGRPVWYHALPRRSTMNEDGNWVPGDLLPRYEPLWSLACRWADIFFAALESVPEASEPGASEPDRPVRVLYNLDGFDLHAAAIEALSYNYRLGPHEVDLLGLLTEPLCVKILGAVIDEPTLLELQKKRVAFSSIVAGPPDSTADTGRQ